MGALSLNAIDKRVREAIEDGTKMVSLQRLVARGPPSQVTPLLRDLASVTTGLKIRHDVLLLAALDYDFGTRRVANDDFKPTPELLEVYRHFVLNLASVSARFVKPALQSLARRGLFHNDESVREMTINLVLALLQLYPQATELAASVLLQFYPHHIRPEEELSLYTRGLLTIFERTTSPILREGIIHAVIDKLIAVQGIVPSDIHEVPEAINDAPRVVSFDLPEEKLLCESAKKMDTLLIVVFKFLDNAKSLFNDSYPEIVIEPIITAFARFVAPAYGGRFLSLVLLRALALSNSDVAERVIDQLSIVFFDSAVHRDIRLFYLSLSSALIIRIPCITSRFVLSWLKRVCQWLSHYIQHNPDLPGNPDFAFAAACAVRVIIERRDAVNRNDELARLRIIRILRVARLPHELRKRFCLLVNEFGGVDVRSMAKACPGRDLRRRSTKLLLQSIELPKSKDSMKEYYRERDFVDPLEGVRNRIESAVPVPTPMVLSSS